MIGVFSYDGIIATFVRSGVCPCLTDTDKDTEI